MSESKDPLAEARVENCTVTVSMPYPKQFFTKGEYEDFYLQFMLKEFLLKSYNCVDCKEIFQIKEFCMHMENNAINNEEKTRWENLRNLLKRAKHEEFIEMHTNGISIIVTISFSSMRFANRFTKAINRNNI